MFSVLLSNRAKKQLHNIDVRMKGRVLELFGALEQDPVPYKEYDLRKLEARSETYRIRLSIFRIVYQVLWSEKTILVAKIERRSETTYDDI